jgi:indole-3-glycerol phosphate synthase
LAGIYEQNGAAVISVITDNQFFQGDKGYAVEVRRQTALPILRKDFIIHEVQLYESVVLGADLVLLIAALHDYKSLLALSEKSRQLNLYPLVEVHDKKELQTALDLPVQLIGLNNRNLHDFTTNLKTSLELAGYIPDRYIKVSESGIKNRADMRQLEQAGCNAALIGETLVTSKDPGAMLNELMNYRGDE